MNHPMTLWVVEKTLSRRPQNPVESVLSEASQASRVSYRIPDPRQFPLVVPTEVEEPYRLSQFGTPVRP